jgi:hypothetical protein
VQVNAGGSLKLGTDGAFTSGTVTFDKPPGPYAGSQTAIACRGMLGSPASVDDLDSTATPSIQVRHTFVDLDIGDYCTVTLAGHPIFGSAPPCDVFQQDGLIVDGAASVTISNATFQCFQNEAILMRSKSGLSPTVGGSSNTITSSATGVRCLAGTFSMTATAITGNGFGVV